MENEEVKLSTLKSIIFYVAFMKDKYNWNVNLVFSFAVCALIPQISCCVTLILWKFVW